MLMLLCTDAPYIEVEQRDYIKYSKGFQKGMEHYKQATYRVESFYQANTFVYGR